MSVDNVQYNIGTIKAFSPRLHDIFLYLYNYTYCVLFNIQYSIFSWLREMNEKIVYCWEGWRGFASNYEPHMHNILLYDTHCHHESQRTSIDKQAEQTNHKPRKNSTDYPIPPSTLQLKQILLVSSITYYESKKCYLISCILCFIK